MDRLNRIAAERAEAALSACCGGREWAARLAAHRPYPGTDALLAAADEACYDLTPADLDEALAAERPHGPRPETTPATALTALRAAHAAYESRFGHVFVIALDAFPPDERLDQTLAALRTRLGNDREDERAVAAEELRKVARARLARLVDRFAEEAEESGEFPDSGRSGSPYVPV